LKIFFRSWWVFITCCLQRNANKDCWLWARKKVWQKNEKLLVFREKKKFQTVSKRNNLYSVKLYRFFRLDGPQHNKRRKNFIKARNISLLGPIFFFYRSVFSINSLQLIATVNLIYYYVLDIIPIELLQLWFAASLIKLFFSFWFIEANLWEILGGFFGAIGVWIYFYMAQFSIINRLFGENL
jgi:hypothetical protein